jgi:hypothetical protein
MKIYQAKIKIEVEDGKVVINLAELIQHLQSIQEDGAVCGVCQCMDFIRDANGDLCCANCDTPLNQTQ